MLTVPYRMNPGAYVVLTPPSLIREGKKKSSLALTCLPGSPADDEGDDAAVPLARQHGCFDTSPTRGIFLMYIHPLILNLVHHDA